MIPSDHELLRLQVEALFTHDAAGRIVSKNKPVYALAPRLFIGRSVAGTLCRYRDDVPADLIAALEPLLRTEPTLERLDALPMIRTEIVAALAQHQPITEIYAGPAWHLPDHLPATSRAVLVAPDDPDALRPNYSALAENLAAMSPCAAVMEHGVAVSVCFSARISPSVAEAGLDTVASARGRGYGADVVIAWADALRGTGRIPLYSTSWDNLASRRVAVKLGAVQYGVDLSIY